MRPAALFIDLQNDYLTFQNSERVVAGSARFLDECRSKGIPVIHVWTSIDPRENRPMPHWKRDHRAICLMGTYGHAPPEILTPLPLEKIIHKTFFSAFSNPDLLPFLRERQIDTLYVAGVHLHACIRATLLDAYSHGFKLIAIEEAVGSNDPLHGAITKNYLEKRCVTFERRDPPPLVSRIADRLRDRAPDLARAIALEIGKPIRQARVEVLRAADLLRNLLNYRHDLEERPSPNFKLRFRPLGTVGIITPWNNPIFIPVGKIGPALFYGNRVIWKPSPFAPKVSEALAECIRESGGSIEVIQGGKEEALSLARDGKIDALTFSGSEKGGNVLRELCAKRGIPFQGELGGNNGTIVWSDSDLADAAKQVAQGAFGFAGQRCTAGRRLIVDEACFEPFLDQLKKEISSLRWGDPLDEATDIGPLISFEKCEELQALLEKADYSSLWSSLWSPSQAAPKGPYFPPTLLVVERYQEIVQEESFGPILVVQKAKSWDEAIALANGVRQGLVLALFSQSREKIEDFLDRGEAGILKINKGTADADPEAPFTGWKSSGYGPPEHGICDREFYTKMQTIY